MCALPVVKMTLYKHGVGFYQRRGRVDGETAELQFRKDEMNDVLKSLTAYTIGGGQVLGVDYETPEDKAELLARCPINLSDEAALRDLLRDLRGRAVEVTRMMGEVSGVVVGVDLPGEREPISATLLSLVDAETHAVVPVQLEEIEQLALVDERAAQDLAYFLETSLAAEDKRAVTVRVAPAGAELVASYIAPSPTWRVSYRLVADETGQDSAAGIQAAGLLQGWGLFDNTLDEDLEEIELALVAGMPVSFIYDLYTPFTPERPVVKEQARAVAGPVEFDQAMLEAPGAPSASAKGGARAMRAMAAGAPAGTPAPMAISAASVGESTALAASGQAQGEFFSYMVKSPVSVRRGRSAMVPIVQQAVVYGRQRIYNGRKHPLNPVVTARFKNETGLTLERGPLTVIEDGEYAGEAMLAFSSPGAEIYLAYAVDLGVKVTEDFDSRRVIAAIHIERGLLVIEEYDVRATRYRVENGNDRTVRVVLEHPRLPGYEPYETPEPEETTVDTYRHVVEVSAHGLAEFKAQERRLLARREEVRSQKVEQLRRWLREHLLDERTFEALQKVLALYDRIGEYETQQRKNESARQEIYTEQKQIQGNLAALRQEGDEGRLRARYVRSLGEQEDALAKLREADEALRQAIAATQSEIDAALAEFKS